MADVINPAPVRKRPLSVLVPRLILGSILFWLPIIIFLALANQIRGNAALPGDVAILQAIHTQATPLFDRFFLITTQFGGAYIVTAGIALACAALYLRKRSRDALFLLFAASGTVLINVLFKLTFQRTRPSLWERLVVENGYSFPSGHAMISSTVALSVILICWHGRYRLAALIGGTVYFLLISLSRLYLGVHFPSDVVAGWCVSVLWVMTLHYIFGRFGRRQSPADTSGMR